VFCNSSPWRCSGFFHAADQQDGIFQESHWASLSCRSLVRTSTYKSCRSISPVVSCPCQKHRPLTREPSGTCDKLLFGFRFQTLGCRWSGNGRLELWRTWSPLKSQGQGLPFKVYLTFADENGANLLANRWIQPPDKIKEGFFFNVVSSCLTCFGLRHGVPLSSSNGMSSHATLHQNYYIIYIWLVVWNMKFMTFHIIIGNLIIPSDQYIFSEGLKPPSR